MSQCVKRYNTFRFTCKALKRHQCTQTTIKMNSKRMKTGFAIVCFLSFLNMWVVNGQYYNVGLPGNRVNVDSRLLDLLGFALADYQPRQRAGLQWRSTNNDEFYKRRGRGQGPRSSEFLNSIHGFLNRLQIRAEGTRAPYEEVPNGAGY